jgi:hypothetical protein
MTGRPGRGGGIPLNDPTRQTANGFDKRHDDFEPGNLVALKHGASSPRILEAKAGEIHTALLDVAPWISQLDEVAVRRYVRVEARAVLLSDYTITKALDSGVGSVPAAMWDVSLKADLAADKLASSLGLTPTSRAALLKDVGAAKRNNAEADIKSLLTAGSKTKAGRQSRKASK